MLFLISTKVSKVFGITSGFELVNKQYVFDVIIGVLSACIVYFILSFYNLESSSKRVTSIGKTLAGFSYTLYLVHFPVINFISGMTGSTDDAPNMPWQRGTMSYFIFMPLAFIGILLYAWVISLGTERYTDKIRRLLLRKPKEAKTSSPNVIAS